MVKSKDYKKEPKDGEIKKLKAHIRHQDKEIARLKSELRTYDRVFSKNLMFLKEKTFDLSVEELIVGAEKEMSLREIKDDKKDRFSELQRKWKCYHCPDGILRLMIIPGGDSNRYFRKCSMCEHRTEVKTYNEEVEGIK